MRFPKILILILNWNGKKDTLECLASLAAALPSPQFATLVIDNGSTDDSVVAIRATFPEIPVLETNKNLGFAGGNNEGIRWALSKSFDWILLLNNDTIVAPDFLFHFMEAVKEQPEGKIFGAKTYLYHDRNRLDQWGANWNPKTAEFESFAVGKLDDGSYDAMRQVDMISGSALLMHRSVPEAIGFLEESFFLLWEESDFCWRAKRAGFPIWTAPHSKVWHKGSASFRGGKPELHYFWWRNRLLWISRNCSPIEKRKIYKTILLQEMAHLIKLSCIKTTESALLWLIGRAPDTKKWMKARRYRAGCRGILDYFLGRFGPCSVQYRR